MPETAAVPLDVVRTILGEGPPLRLALLFGSHARGRARPDSDVDIGVIPVDPALPLRDELHLQARLERACGRPVQLVRLDHSSTLLKWEAARHGVPLIVRSPTDHSRFVAHAALEHADLGPALARAAALFHARLRDAARREAR